MSEGTRTCNFCGGKVFWGAPHTDCYTTVMRVEQAQANAVPAHESPVSPRPGERVETTPGPWKVERYVVDAVTDQEVGAWSRGNLRERRRIVAGENAHLGPVIADMVFGGAADARLIAESPALYELMKDVVAYMEQLAHRTCACEHCRFQREVIGRARAIVARIEGES